MELHQCLGWVESQSETPILVVLSALLRNFYWYMYKEGFAQCVSVPLAAVLLALSH
jgi:hypothetical protein